MPLWRLVLTHNPRCSLAYRHDIPVSAPAGLRVAVFPLCAVCPNFPLLIWMPASGLGPTLLSITWSQLDRVCKDPTSKGSHTPSYQGLRSDHLFWGDTIPPATDTDSIQTLNNPPEATKTPLRTTPPEAGTAPPSSHSCAHRCHPRGPRQRAEKKSSTFTRRLAEDPTCLLKRCPPGGPGGLSGWSVCLSLSLPTAHLCLSRLQKQRNVKKQNKKTKTLPSFYLSPRSRLTALLSGSCGMR